MHLSWTDYTPNRLGCDCGQQKNDEVDGMPVTKRSVHDVVQKRKHDRVGGEWKRVVAAASNEHGDAKERFHPERTAQSIKARTNQESVARKFCRVMGRPIQNAEKRSAKDQLYTRMGDDEAHGLAPLLVHERGFAHAEIARGLAVFRYVAGKSANACRHSFRAKDWSSA